MTDHREKAVNLASVSPLDANIHALLFLGDQVKRIADALEAPTTSRTDVVVEELGGARRETWTREQEWGTR